MQFDDDADPVRYGGGNADGGVDFGRGEWVVHILVGLDERFIGGVVGDEMGEVWRERSIEDRGGEYRNMIFFP